ncbi:hypothetical protein NDU88_006793 [Pleurodeles waltl]|uniref:Uncharacterized protein n=1 Tax=Pleurodeles waltl TaxID=8319 RepID=A0AAV7NZ39_PLEWA|nr:hypothetical protein NDU88_006793 [Pleurodeles waltl]
MMGAIESTVVRADVANLLRSLPFEIDGLPQCALYFGSGSCLGSADNGPNSKPDQPLIAAERTLRIWFHHRAAASVADSGVAVVGAGDAQRPAHRWGLGMALWRVPLPANGALVTMQAF